MGLFRRKPKKNEEPKRVKAEPVTMPKDGNYKCIFCGQSFTADQLVFGIDSAVENDMYKDMDYERSMHRYQPISADFKDNETGITTRIEGLKSAYRRIIDSSKPSFEVLYKEKNGLPVTVKGPLKETNEQSSVQEQTGDGLSFGQNDQMTTASSGRSGGAIVESSKRYCPHCHFTVPIGIGEYKVIRVGLIGGPRSGKTTYMSVVTEYIRHKFANTNSGLNLADVEILPECANYETALYESQRPMGGAAPNAVMMDVEDQLILPVILFVTPLDKNYEPFYLVFQDIPGEYLKTQNEHLLVQSAIPNSTDLVMLVDINHFIETSQQINREFGQWCPQEFDTLFNNLRNLGQRFQNGKLNSVQVTLTKLDFWMEAEEEKLRDAVFTQSGDEAHEYAIDDHRLAMVHDQIVERLSHIGDQNQSGILDKTLRSLGLDEEAGLHKAYTAVASRLIPGNEEEVRQNGTEWKRSLNVLEPILNILDWHNALPVKNRG